MFRSHVAGVFPLHREQILRFFHVQDLISCEILRYSPEEKNRGCEIFYSAHIHKYRTLFLDIIVTSEFNCWCFCCNIPFNSGKALTSVSCHSLTQNFSKLNSMESASGSWREKSVPYFKTTQQWTTTLALAADQFFSIGFSNLQLLRCQLIFFEAILKLTWRHVLKCNLSVENMFKRINTNFKFDCDFHFPRMPPLVSFL